MATPRIPLALDRLSRRATQHILYVAGLGLVALIVLAIWASSLKQCAVCGETIWFADAYEEPEFGDVYHAYHTQITRCDYCGRILSDYSSAGPGVWKLDGRRMCPVCHQAAIVDWDEARKIEADVRVRMRRWGLKFESGAVPVALVDEVTLRRLFQVRGATDGQIEGLTEDRLDHGVEETQVYVLSGLPRSRCRWVVAHELMHAWLFRHHAPVHRPRLEEGAGELAAYRITRENPSPTEARVLATALSNPDPVYGAGLRLAAAYEQRHGFPAFMHLLETRTDFPTSRGRG